MAIAFVATRYNAAGSAYTAGGTFTFSPATNTVAGNTLLMAVAMDPTTGATAIPYISVSDSKGNSWQMVVQQVNGAAGSGAAVAILYCKVNFPILTTDTIVVRGPGATASTRVVVQVHEYSGVSVVHNQSFTEVVPPTFSTGNSTTQGSLAQTPTASGQMMFGAVGIETNTAVTGDADVTNGAWAAVSTTLSNSGADLTSVTLSVQTKTVTGAGAQNWATTTAAAKLYAAGIVTLAAAPATVAPAFPAGNPNYPTVLGFEGLPTMTAALPVDTGTGYIYKYKTNPDELGSSFQVVGAEYLLPAEASQHHIAYDWYDPNSLVDASADDIQTLYLPLRRASITNLPGSTATSGGGTSDAAFLAALSAPGGTFVTLGGAGSELELWFDPTTLLAQYPNSRIVNFGIQYIAFKDDSAPTNPGQGYSVIVQDLATDLGIGLSDFVGWWLTNFYKRDNKYETRWFGEMNARPRTSTGLIGVAGHTLNMGAPWRVADLGHMQAADQSVSFLITGEPGQIPPDDILQNVVYFDYIQMVVQLAPERRIGCGIRTVSNTYSAFGAYPPTFDWTRFQHPTRTDLLAQAGLGTNNYAVLVRESAPASESDWMRLGIPGTAALTSLFEAVGPSAALKGFTQPRETLTTQPDTAFVPIVNGAPFGAVQDFPSYTTSVEVFDENDLVAYGPSFGGYRGMAPGNNIQVYTAHNLTAGLKLANGSQQYTKLKVLVKSDPANGQNITFSVQQPLATPIATVTLTPTQPALTGTPAGNGWYEVVATLSVPITPAAGNVFVVASSSADPATPWYWAAADPDNGQAERSYSAPFAATGGTAIYDYAATLVAVLPAPTVTMSSTTTPAFRASGRCLTTPETLPHFAITNGASFDRIVVFRYDTAGNATLVKTIDHPTNASVFDDFMVPWDVAANGITYVVFGERFSTNESVSANFTWNDTSVAPGAAIGISYNAPLSGAAEQGTYPSFDMIYVPGDSSLLKMEWHSLNGTTYVPLHGVDMQYALRANEQRGLKMSCTVIVDHFATATCGTETSDYQLKAAVSKTLETLAQDGQSMSPQVFGADLPGKFSAGAGTGNRVDLRQLDRLAKPVTVKFPGGHTRLMNVIINSMVSTPSAGVFMAELEFTDASPLDFITANSFGT